MLANLYHGDRNLLQDDHQADIGVQQDLQVCQHHTNPDKSKCDNALAIR